MAIETTDYGRVRWHPGSGDDAVIDLRREDRPLVDLAPVTGEVASPAGKNGFHAASRLQLAAKRATDIVGSLAALVVLTPLLLIVAAAIALTSPGRIFFVHERVGKDGRLFKMLKFRSMYENAHRDRRFHASRNEASGPVFKIKNDPRITPVGRIIRRLSIDELPQLINVLRGQMTLVGPRPPLPEEYVQYGFRERRRLEVKPGVTCIWQVSGRSDLDFDTWVEMDIEYIDTWTLRRDLALLARTIPAVVSGRGAY